MTAEKDSLTVEVRASRQLIGRVYRGRGLQDSFRQLVDEHSLQTAWVSAIGAFEWIEISEYNQTERRYEEARRFERCELLTMDGNLSERDGEPFWHLHATVSRREDGRDVTYGGHVVDGSVFALEFRIDCFDELQLKRVKDAATGLQLWEGRDTSTLEAPVLPAQKLEPAGVTWAMAAEFSAPAEPRDLVQYKPEKGDWIEHAKFGLCKIEGLGGDGVCIIKLPDARRKKIKLDALQVLAPRRDDARRIFPVRAKPKG